MSEWNYSLNPQVGKLLSDRPCPKCSSTTVRYFGVTHVIRNIGATWHTEKMLALAFDDVMCELCEFRFVLLREWME
jgi:hypothetical protein